jgi:hypothetical protein
MTFYSASRGWTTMKFPTKASVTYSAGMFIYNDATDNVPATTTTQSNVIGIAKEAKASSSTTTSIHVLVPTSEACTFKATGCSGTLTKALEGDQFDFASGGLTVAQGASTYDTVQLVKFIDASTGIFRLNPTRGIEN